MAMNMTSNSSNYLSHYHGEMDARKVNVLASCYMVDSTGHLKGLHYSTTGASGAEWYS
jgi:hypothetical protein